MADGQMATDQTGAMAALSDDIINAAKAEIEKAMSGALNHSVNMSQGAPAPVQSESEEDVMYVEPIQDPYGKAIKYLEQHNILQLFQALTSNIVYHKPEDPLGFMMKEIETIKGNRKDTHAES